MTLPRTPFPDLRDDLRAALGPKVERLGYLGEFFQVAAAQPDALAGFVAFTDALKQALPADLTELVALTVATETGNDYERVQHERLALALGHDEAWVRAVERRARAARADEGGRGADQHRARAAPADEGALDEGALDPRHAAVQALVLAMVRSTGRDAGPLLAEVEAHLPADQVVAVLLTVCRYLGHAAVANTLGLTAPVASPLTRPQKGAIHG